MENGLRGFAGDHTDSGEVGLRSGSNGGMVRNHSRLTGTAYGAVSTGASGPSPPDYFRKPMHARALALELRLYAGIIEGMIGASFVKRTALPRSVHRVTR